MNSKEEYHSEWMIQIVLKDRYRLDIKEVPGTTWSGMDCKNSYTSSNTAYHSTMCAGLFAVAIGCGITSKDDNENIATVLFYI